MLTLFFSLTTTAHTFTSTLAREKTAACAANYAMDVIEQVLQVSFSASERETNIQIQQKLATKTNGAHPLWCALNTDTPGVHVCLFSPINRANTYDFKGDVAVANTTDAITFERANSKKTVSTTLLLPANAKVQRLLFFWDAILLYGSQKLDTLLSKDVQDSPGLLLHQHQELVDGPHPGTKEYVEAYSRLESSLYPFQTLGKDLNQRRSLNTGKYAGRLSLQDEQEAIAKAGVFRPSPIQFEHLVSRHRDPNLNLPHFTDIATDKFIQCLQSID
jgi:hypothetical protein